MIAVLRCVKLGNSFTHHYCFCTTLKWYWKANVPTPYCFQSYWNCYVIQKWFNVQWPHKVLVKNDEILVPIQLLQIVNLKLPSQTIWIEVKTNKTQSLTFGAYFVTLSYNCSIELGIKHSTSLKNYDILSNELMLVS